MRTPEGGASHVTSSLVGVFSCAASGASQTRSWLTCVAYVRAIVKLRPIGQEGDREVHGHPRRGAERTPFRRQGGDQRQPGSFLRAGWSAHSRQRTRRVVDVNAQMTAGAPDDKHDGLGVAVHDGTGHQVAGEQNRDVGIDRNLPGPDDRADLAAGLRRRRWFPGEPEATLLQFGRASLCHRVYPVPQLTYSVPVAPQILLQLALQYIGQLTDIERRPERQWFQLRLSPPSRASAPAAPKVPDRHHAGRSASVRKSTSRGQAEPNRTDNVRRARNSRRDGHAGR